MSHASAIPVGKLAFGTAAVLFALALCVGVWYSEFRLVENRRVTSPDGRFYATVYCRLWDSHGFAGMGTGGDQPGYVTVYTREGQSCGSAPIELAWMVGDIEWLPGRASLHDVAEWDLVRREIVY